MTNRTPIFTVAMIATIALSALAGTLTTAVKADRPDDVALQQALQSSGQEEKVTDGYQDVNNPFMDKYTDLLNGDGSRNYDHDNGAYAGGHDEATDDIDGEGAGGSGSNSDNNKNNDVDDGSSSTESEDDSHDNGNHNGDENND